ncbi:MAG: stalk domain-containing protein [Bacillota bacterium]
MKSKIRENKIIISFLLVVTLLLSQYMAVFSEEIISEAYRYFADGIEYVPDVPFVKVDNEIFAPVRLIAESMKLEVTWDGVNQQIVLEGSGNILKMKIGSSEYTFNNISGTMPQSPMIYNGRTYVPLKFIAGMFGFTVTVNETEKRIEVFTPTVRVSDLTIYNSSYEIYIDAQPKLVTRAELCRFLVKSLGLDVNVIPSQLFPDVPSDHEYFKDIYIAIDNGLIKGYPDGMFMPERNITRSEYAALLCRALKYDEPVNNVIINDIRGHWAERHIKTVVDAGLMGVNEDNCFEPNNYLSMDLSGQIIPIISPWNADNKKVIWKSDNEDVAVVDNTGRIIGKSPGSAKITCTTEDGGIIRTCNVTIKNVEPTPIMVLYGYIKPEVDSQSINICQGFKVEIEGTDNYTSTNEEGYFEITCPLSDLGLQPYIIISKAGYLTRKQTVNFSSEQSSKESPIAIWPGDMGQNACINMEDVMEIIKSFNTAEGDERYNIVCDYDQNGAINMADIVCTLQWFNRSSNDY